MNWKNEAIDRLKDYTARKNALGCLEEEIRRLEVRAEGLKSGLTEEQRVKSSGYQQDALLSNLVGRQELERQRRWAELWVSAVDHAMECLSEEERLVLKRLFVEPGKGNVDRLCEELMVEKATVYRRRDEALRHFTIAMYGAEMA